MFSSASIFLELPTRNNKPQFDFGKYGDYLRLMKPLFPRLSSSSVFGLPLLLSLIVGFQLEAAPSSHDKLVQKLKTIRIPEVQLERVPLPEALAYLISVSRKHDPEAAANPQSAGINIVWLSPESPPPVITLKVRNLNVGNILGFITDLTGYVYEVREHAVVVRKPLPKKRQQSIGPLLETEIYELGEGLRRRLSGGL